MSSEAIAIFLIILSLLGVTTWLVWVISTNMRRSRMFKGQIDLQTRLIDKLGSSQELLAYLESGIGQELVQGIVDRADPAGRILNALHVGVVLVMLGIGFLTVDGSVPGASTSGVFMLLGILSLALGAGFLIAAGVTYALTRAWGLLDRSMPRRP